MKLNQFISVMIVSAGVLASGCANNVYDYGKTSKDAKQLNSAVGDEANAKLVGENRIIIRYHAAYDESAMPTKGGGNSSLRFAAIPANSIYVASCLQQILKEKIPDAQVMMQPVVEYMGRERLAESGGAKFNLASRPISAFSEQEFPGSSVYVDIIFSPSLDKPPIRVLPNGVLTRVSGQTFGRWLSFNFRVYAANGILPETNGVLATNSVSVLKNDLDIKYAPQPFSSLHPYNILGSSSIEALNARTIRQLPVRLNKIVYFNKFDSFVLDEEKLSAEPVKGNLKETSSEYRALGSLTDVIKSSLLAIDQEKAIHYSSIPWVSFYDPDLAERIELNKPAVGDSRRMALLKMIDKEEVAFLQAASNRLSESVMFGDYGKSYRIVRLAENKYINEVIGSHSQANNAALIAGLTTMQSQLSSYSARGSGLSGAIGGLQSNINTLNSISANQSNLNNAMSGISAAGTKFSAGMNAYQNQIYKFVSQNSGKTTEIKAGSLGELRYQFLKLYRAETKGF